MGYDCIELKTVRLFGLRKGGDMMRRKSLMSIVLMVSGTGLHGMMCIQLRDMPVEKSTLTKYTSVVKREQIPDIPMILPKAFIAESPILQDIEKDLVLKRMKLRGLFEDQPMHVVLRVIEYQEALCSGKAFTIECSRSIERAYDIALMKRLQLNALLAEYRERIKSSRN
jgi:hypothetical protein